MSFFYSRTNAIQATFTYALKICKDSLNRDAHTSNKLWTILPAIEAVCYFATVCGLLMSCFDEDLAICSVCQKGFELPSTILFSSNNREESLLGVYLELIRFRERIMPPFSLFRNRSSTWMMLEAHN